MNSDYRNPHITMITIPLGEYENLKLWKDTIEQACITDWVTITTPEETLANLISWNIKMALDPKISKDANDLIELGKSLRE